MSAIDEVIARSRLPGGFASQRKTFSLARKRAIRKMREFALADPYYFVLELIQAAVAQGASYINVRTDRDDFTLSYTGGHFRETELGQLFDFLFAGKDRTDLGPVRELALGLNALLLFRPARIVVLSGDGTTAGTTRMEIGQDAEQVDVGRASRPLRGTFIRAEGLRRGPLRKKTALSPLPGLPLEVAAIEERCLTAPIPLVVNGDPLFGFSTRRVPRLLGYGRVLEFDEGDLYGSIGIRPQAFQASFKLLTFGVWIQTVTYALLPGGPEVGGVLCFDHLHKTADHSGLVQDERWQELWARLRPYAERLVRGERGTVAGTVSVLSGAPLSTRELRPLMRASERVCLVGPEVDAHSEEGQLAARIGRALDSLVLRVGSGDEAWIRALAGPEVALLRLDLSGDGDAPFYLQGARAAPPPRPWLASEVALASVSLDQLLEDLEAQLYGAGGLGEADRQELDRLRSRGAVEATIYTPAEPAVGTRLTVQLITVDRVAWEGHFPSPYPGHVLQVRLPDCSPRWLRARVGVKGAERSLARYLAWLMAHRAVPALASASRRALTRTSRQEAPGSAARAIAVAALRRSLVARLHGDAQGRPQVCFSLLGREVSADLLERPLFRRLHGGWASPRDLERELNEEGGLVYGVVPTVPPVLDGLRAHRILSLQPDEEQMLLGLLGDASYVRVDQRDVLAEHGGSCCRDLALGMRSYPDFPLLVEGADPTGLPAAQQEALVEALVLQLARVFVGADPEPPADPAAVPGWQENRRHACRHLQYFVCRREALAPDGPHFGVVDLPLFLDPDGRAFTFRQVRRALQRPQALVLRLRPALGGSEPGALVAAAPREPEAPEAREAPEAPEALAVSPFLARLLSPLQGTTFSLELDLPHERAASEEARPYLQGEEVSGEGFTGVVGLPRDPQIRPEVFVLEPGRSLRDLACTAASRFGMRGLVRLDEDDRRVTLQADLEVALQRAGERLIQGLLEQLGRLLSESRSAEAEGALTRLLSFAGEHLSLVATPEGRLYAEVLHPLAERVLELPLFPGRDGVRLSGRSLVEAFCAYGPDYTHGAARGGGVDVDALSPALQDFLARYLVEARVARPASQGRVPKDAAEGEADRPEDVAVAAAVQYWLEHARPDRLRTGPGEERVPFLVQVRPEPQFRYYGGAQPLVALTTVEHAPLLVLNGDHWLVAHARAHLRSDPVSLMSLLLAVYAAVNAALDPVTNRHEQAFQRRLAEALERGELGPVDAGPPA